MSAADILNAAADLLEGEGRWTQDAYARDKSGREVSLESISAWSFDMVGAVNRACISLRASDSDASAAHSRLAEVGQHNATAWNDLPGRTQSEVVEALRTAASATT